VQLKEQADALQGRVEAHARELQQARANAIDLSQRYYSTTAGINARLQVGTTPGNPILRQQWAQASQELDRMASEVGRMSAAQAGVQQDASQAAFMLEQVRAAYQVQGAVDDDHRMLRQIEDQTNRTVVTIDRIQGELSEDVRRQTAYVAQERSNLNLLQAAVTAGAQTGPSLANRPVVGTDLNETAIEAAVIQIAADPQLRGLTGRNNALNRLFIDGTSLPGDRVFSTGGSGALPIQLEVTLTTEKMRNGGVAPHILSRGSADAAMYWSAAQIVTHHSANGCNLQPGDLIGTGTLSTDSAGGLGSLLEISQGGKQPVALSTGEARSFLENGDELTLKAWCEGDGAVRIGFGECVGRVVAAT
jgi:hypothetical protein